MSIRAMVWAFDTPCPTPAAKLVLLKLADHANDEGECWPSQGRIAADCGLTRETVNRQIKALADAGLIRTQQQTNGTGQHANRYFLRCDILSHPGVTTDHTPCDLSSHKPSINHQEEDSFATLRPPIDPTKEVFDRGVAMLGKARRSLLGKFCKQHGEVAVLEALVATEEANPVDPVSFFVACMTRAPPRNGHANGHDKDSPVTKLYRGAMRAADKLDREEADRRAGIAPLIPLLDG